MTDFNNPIEYCRFSSTKISDYLQFYKNLQDSNIGRFLTAAWDNFLLAYFQVAKVPMDLQNWKLWVTSFIPLLENPKNAQHFDELKSFSFFRFFFFPSLAPNSNIYELEFMDKMNRLSQDWFGSQASNECVLAVVVTCEVCISLFKLFRKNLFSLNHFIPLSRIITHEIEGQSTFFSLLQEILKSKSVENIQEDLRRGQVDRQYFSLIAPLELLFSQLAIDEIKKLSRSFQTLSQLDLTILGQSIQFDLFILEELSPNGEEEMNSSLPVYDSHVPLNLTNINNNNNNNQGGLPKLPVSDVSPVLLSKPIVSHRSLVLSIISQPPLNTVYKRNLRPFPQVTLSGIIDPNKKGIYQVIPLLVRCDSYLDESKYLLGAKLQEISPGRVVAFKKLKITTTSHQQGETLFCLRIELRRYLSEDDIGSDRFTIEDLIYTNPITVLSHSTQLKPVPTVSPTISEIIPNSSPTIGATRIVIIGSNLGEGPYCRIKFDNSEVIPQSWGPGTWICHCPSHPSGTVQVRVSNDAKTWSSNYVMFVYEEDNDNQLTWNDFLEEEQ